MNRKKGIIVAVMLLAFMYVKGQDNIITTQRDTISCRIVSISLKRIKYECKDDSGVVNKLIPMKQVRGYSLGARRLNDSIPAASNGEQSVKPFLNQQKTINFIALLKKEQEAEETFL